MKGKRNGQNSRQIVDDDNNNSHKTEKRENYKRLPTITNGRRTKTEGAQESI